VISGLLQTFPAATAGRYEAIAALYAPLLARTIVLRPFFGSCAVFLPPDLTLDLAAVCAASGYIHSCGHNVFSRNVEKTEREDFFNAITSHLDRHATAGSKLFFAVYTHEDFTGFDRREAAELLHGLDDVKVYVEKFYMGSDRLVSVLKAMREQYDGRLEIPDPGDFRDKHRAFRGHPGVDTSRTVWLIRDRAISQDIRTPGDDTYFICYDQLFRNENPFHLFDENKPGWLAPTTIPHTLLGAMLNLSRPWWPKVEQVRIHDPFAGTGTTWLEACKYGETAVTCTDYDEMCVLVAHDNAGLFAARAEALGPLVHQLTGLIGLLREGEAPVRVGGGAENDPSYVWALDCLERIGVAEAEYPSPLPSGIVAELRGRSLYERLLFYVGLRTRFRNVAGFMRGSSEWRTAYQKEAQVLKEQLSELRDLKLRARAGAVLSNGVATFQGKYSTSCTMAAWARCELEGTGAKVWGVDVADATTVGGGAWHLVVTDPPYGFNTSADRQEIARLYGATIEALVESVADDGQLLLSLGDRARIGRSLSFVTQKEFVTQQVVLAAERCGREVIVAHQLIGPAKSVFDPPYYWESEKALRRAILHFRILRRRG
jgi:16S rRNA G966 N2-methylase RsmD